jgi:GDP-4-dehydro-6-deoxy-D-mannose reductase
MAVWLITGATGFLGRHVLSLLGGGAGEVVVLGRRCPRGWAGGRFVATDLDDPEGLVRALARIEPDVVIHAAGRTPPADEASLYRSNTLATLHLLDALRSTGRAVRVVLAGSAAELGAVPVEALPVGEGYPCRPVGAYGLGKWLATCAGLAARPPLEVVVGRVFNPIGPGLPESQAFGRFAARLADRSTRELTVGNLDARRDFVDVRDVARALITLGEQGAPGRIYNIGTGRSRRVGDGLEYLLRCCGRSVSIQVGPGHAAPGGPSDSRADVRRIEVETGWRPVFSWEQSLDDLWNEAKRGTVLPLTG